MKFMLVYDEFLLFTLVPFLQFDHSSPTKINGPYKRVDPPSDRFYNPRSRFVFSKRSTF